MKHEIILELDTQGSFIDAQKWTAMAMLNPDTGLLYSVAKSTPRKRWIWFGSEITKYEITMSFKDKKSKKDFLREIDRIKKRR